MNKLACYCGAIDYELISTTTLTKKIGELKIVETSAPPLINDTCKQLNKYVFNDGDIKEYSFCNRCGAPIYFIRHNGSVLHTINKKQSFEDDYSGVLRFGF